MKIINFKYSSNQISSFFFLISVFFFPIDSFPYFPTDNEYRPISFFFLIPIFILYISKLKLRKHDLFLVLLVISLIFHSVLMSFLFIGKFNHLPKVFLTLIIYFISSVSISSVIYNELSSDHKTFLLKLGNICTLSLILIFLIGFIQLFSILSFFPISLADEITSFFSYRSVNRIQGISGEPSWMVRYLCLFGVISYFFYVGTGKKIVNFLIFLFLLLSGSVYGYLLVLFSILVYFFSFKFNSKFLFFIFVLVLSVFFAAKFINQYDGTNYTLKRLSNISNVVSNPEKLNFILEQDGSMFQRIMNPIIGFKAGYYSSYLGLGLDGYRYVYPKIILNDYSYALKFNTVSSAVMGSSYITPKSLYSKIFAELGVFIFIIFIFFIVILRNKIFFLKDFSFKIFSFLSIVFSISFVSILNTDSIINQSFIFSVYLCYILSKLIKDGVHNHSHP